jgi:transposase
MTTLVDTLVPDELWAIIAPLLPTRRVLGGAGRVHTIHDRACFAAVVSMARTFPPWRLLPARELGCGSYATVLRSGDVGSPRASRGAGSNPRSGLALTAGVSSGRCRGSGCWRRLQVRWDRDSGRFFAFALVACAPVCFKQLEPAD